MAGEVSEPAALTVEQLERRAAAGYGLPDGLRPAEQLLFLSLRCLYRDYRSRQLTREQARQEKQRILTQYRRYSRTLDTAARQCRAFVDTTRRTEPGRMLPNCCLWPAALHRRPPGTKRLCGRKLPNDLRGKSALAAALSGQPASGAHPARGACRAAEPRLQDHRGADRYARCGQ